MGKRAQVLIGPDPKLLHERISQKLYDAIVEAGVCLISDVDGTIVDSVPMYCTWLSKKLRHPIEPRNITSYDFTNIDRMALGMLQERVFPNARMHADLPLIEGARETLTKISGRQVPIIVLTARPMKESLVRTTVKHLKKNGIPFDLLIFSREKKAIIQAIKRLGCHVIVVDDDPGVIVSTYRLTDLTPIIFTAHYNTYLDRKGVVRAGETPDDPEKWPVVVREVLKRLED